MWRGKPAQLLLHYENGFVLLESATGSVGREPKILWAYPFEKLRMSADDGHRILWLGFVNEDTEIVSLTLFFWVPSFWLHKTFNSFHQPPIISEN